ncbi:hypothetical protein OHP003_00790 [Helicobacter pylori]|nr:hypothetical protein OHP003_00790 [Helicobacter pylori]
MHVKTRHKLNFRKEKHETDHDYHGVNVAHNTTILKYKPLRVISSWGCLVFTLFVILLSP